MDIKNIYATVKQTDFNSFCQRCRQNDVTISSALTDLVKGYAYGGTMIMPKKVKVHAKPTGVDYNKEKRNGTT